MFGEAKEITLSAPVMGKGSSSETGSKSKASEWIKQDAHPAPTALLENLTDFALALPWLSLSPFFNV